MDKQQLLDLALLIGVYVFACSIVNLDYRNTQRKGKK